MKKENAHPRKAVMSAVKNSVNTTTAITLTYGALPRVDSRLLAQHMGVKHKNSMELPTSPPLSVAVELGVQSQRQEIGHEEAIHARTDHWLPTGS